MRGLIFLYLVDNKDYLLSDTPMKLLKKEIKVIEIIQSFATLKNARAYLSKKNIKFNEKLSRKRDYFDDEMRELLRQKKLGEKNPNSKGLSEKHKKNIGKSMKGKNMAQFNINFGKPRDRLTRSKISHTKLKNNAHITRKWALDEYGNEKLVTLPFILPIGWSWGRKRRVAKLKH